MSSCDGVRPIVIRAGSVHPEGVTCTPHEGSSQPPGTGHQPENWQRVCIRSSESEGRRRVPYIVMVLSFCPSCRVLQYAVDGVRVRGSCTPRRVRRHFLRAVAAAVFYIHAAAATSASCRGTSQQNIAFQMFLQIQTLRRHVSRLVAAGVYFSLKNVAASQYVCSRGADNLSSYVSSFGSDFSSICFGWC